MGHRPGRKGKHMPDDAYFEAVEKQREARAVFLKESATTAIADQSLARLRGTAHQTQQTIHDQNNEGGSHE